MRASASVVFVCTFGVAAWGCRNEPSPRPHAEAAPAPASGTATASPSASAIVAARQDLQKTLALPPRRAHLPRLAFGAKAVGRLRDQDVQVLDDATLVELALIPLEEPRALLAMADGALVALGGGGLVRWERDKRSVPSSARLMLLPGAEVYPDARQADLLWVLEPESVPPTLRSYRLGTSSLSGVLIPEQTIELAGPRGGTFGVTREGVWLYVTAGRAERFAPSGAKLPGLHWRDSAVPSWSLPARRLDQSLWLDEAGTVTRALTSPVFKKLSSARHRGATYAADVGDEGKLLALVAVTGVGPQLELALFDAELNERGRAPLTTASPTGGNDWVSVVTRNVELAVAPRAPRVAVGGPDRLTIYDGVGQVVLSIPIR